MEAGVFTCPACGAAVSGDSTQCQYCGARLQTVACPSCFGLMFVGSKFCPHCGAKAEMPTVVAPTSHHCPRCKVELSRITVGGCPFEECAHCGGLWVNASTFNHICADREAQAAAVDFKLPPPVPFDEKIIYLKCPACLMLMNRENFAHRSGIVIEICRAHGIWLDRDCLRQVIEFIRAGGMDRARQIETEELYRQRALLEADQKVISHDDALMFPSSTRGEAGANELIGGVASVIGWFLR